MFLLYVDSKVRNRIGGVNRCECFEANKQINLQKERT